MPDPAFASATELVAAVVAGRSSARDLLELHLARVAAHNLSLQALTLRAPRSTRAAADRADRVRATGAALGPLHGLPVAVREHQQRDGTAERLAAAGAAVFAVVRPPTTGLPARRADGRFGRPRNPWDRDHAAAIGTGGAAIGVAAGLCPLEVGGDLGVSLRIPAANCGVYAHVPSAAPVGGGAVPVLVPIARQADDLALTVDALAGAGPIRDRGRGSIVGRRIAVWLDDPACPTDPEILARLEAAADALRDAGAIVTRGRPDLDLVGTAHAACRRPPGLDPVPRSCRAWSELFSRHDAVLCPVSPVAPPRQPTRGGRSSVRRTIAGERRRRPFLDQLAWCALTQAAGLPVTVAPVGFTPRGLPVGVQVVGPPGGDRATIDIARQLGRLIGGYATPPALACDQSAMAWMPTKAVGVNRTSHSPFVALRRPNSSAWSSPM